jgi:hypothetical protein
MPHNNNMAEENKTGKCGGVLTLYMLWTRTENILLLYFNN